MENTLISIITVVYNSKATLENTILSVINQTYKNIEYIIIDGGSKDGTIEIIKKYESNLAYWVSEPDNGIYDAMNKGIAKAKGELIGIINSDDWYEVDAVQNIVNEYTINGTGVYYGFLKIWKNDIEHSIRRFHHNFPKESMIQHPTWFVSKSIYDKFGVFDNNFKIAGDFELFQRLIGSHVKFYPVDKLIANFRIGGISTSRSFLGAEEYLKIYKKYNFFSKKELLLKKFKLKIRKAFNQIKIN